MLFFTPARAFVPGSVALVGAAESVSREPPVAERFPAVVPFLGVGLVALLPVVVAGVTEEGALLGGALLGRLHPTSEIDVRAPSMSTAPTLEDKLFIICSLSS